MFAFGAFVFGTVGQELVARDARAAGDDRRGGPSPSSRSCARNRRRYGGYTVHVGMAVLFIGVAASSAFQHARDVRLVPGQSATVGGYRCATTRRRRGSSCAAGGWSGSSSAPCQVSHEGERVGTLRPSAATTRRHRAVRGRSAATSKARRRARSAWRPGCGATCGSPSQPDVAPLRQIKRLNKVLARPPEGRRNVDPSRSARRSGALPGALELTSSAAARDVPDHRLAAGDVGLDRRAARVPRRADRSVAGARQPPRRARCDCRRASRVSSAAPRRRRWTCVAAPGDRRRCSPSVPVVSRPLRAATVRPRAATRTASPTCEAAKEARYREIRELELDHRTGKLDDQTSAPRTVPCAPRRWRSCASSTGRRRRGVAATILGRWTRLLASSRSSSRVS